MKFTLARHTGIAALLAVALPTSAQTLEEIIVRGTKLENTLQQTMDSIAVFPAEVLEERGLISFRDVLDQTAGASGTGRSFRIRGIDSGPVGTLRSELASYYVDGIALSGWVKSEGPQQMWDVSQIEILRGPQSTNLGRNSLAGAVVVTTRRPTYDNGARLRVGVGNFNTTEFSGVANYSIKDGVSALRLSFDQRETDGSVTNITRGEDDIAYDEHQQIRAKWLYEPTPDLSLLTSLQYVNNDYGDNSQAFEGSGFDREDRSALADIRGAYPIEAYIGSLTVDYRFGDSWSLKSITAGMDGERSRRDDFDDSAADEGVVYREGEDSNFSQELRFDYQAPGLRGSSGFYYSRIEADNINDSTVILRPENFGLGFLVDLGAYPARYPLVTGGNTTLETVNTAAFTEWEWDFSSRWRLSLGARYDIEKQEVSFQATGSSPVELPDPADWPGLEGVINLVNTQLAALSLDGPRFTPDTDFEAFLPHVGLTFMWNDDVSTSFFVKRGYRSGGTEITGLNNINSYDAEYLTNYELALRSAFLDGRAIFNANAYYGDWDDQQVNVPELADGDESFTRIINAGQSEIHGLEAEFNLQVTERLNVFATAAWSHTEFVDFLSSDGTDLGGNQFAFAPEETGAIGFDYRPARGFFVNANATYTGSSYADDDNLIELEARTLVNLRGGYQTGDWKAEAYVTNMLDEQYATNIFGLVDAAGNREWGRMGAPREYGLRLTLQF